MAGPEQGRFEAAGGRVPVSRSETGWDKSFDDPGQERFEPQGPRSKLTPQQVEYIAHLKANGLA